MQTYQLDVVAPEAFGAVFSNAILSVSFHVFSIFRGLEKPLVRKKFRGTTVR